jgi:large subunit ribosomal protein L25
MTANKIITVNISERDGSSDALRREYKIPAVLYGPQEDAASIAIDAKEFAQLWRDAGESTIVILSGVGDDKEALIKSVQWHPITDEPVHVDFYVIERGKKLTVSVPLEFIGEAPAEKLNGNVNKIMHELEIEVRPSDIPQHIDVDLTKLTDLNSVITVADLQLPDSAEPALEPTEAVASISVAVEEDLSAPVGDAMPDDESVDGDSDSESSDVAADNKSE